jgi:hypothetical protein
MIENDAASCSGDRNGACSSRMAASISRRNAGTSACTANRSFSSPGLRVICAKIVHPRLFISTSKHLNGALAAFAYYSTTR